MTLYTSERVQTELLTKRAEYEAKIRKGQQPNWSPNKRALDIGCLGFWLQEQLKTRQAELLVHFGRIVRAEQDPFEAAAEVMNIYSEERPLESHYQGFKAKRVRW